MIYFSNSTHTKVHELISILFILWYRYKYKYYNLLNKVQDDWIMIVVLKWDIDENVYNLV